ncbi:helix-turn-helix transcriptional regulator [Actinacidiphila acididurans]|uniref:Helix-turn-helix domain-containing protein n=1 Tax=Actinacidiphila acididurans TaxID=2784346 RepID=A0ABS2TI64_9ACTN|nr:helix-turn-helix transcriptional regulator [Actinacidiphila acididurans]MBM9503024.1 helix-turn-helix domain-containing protein [Actinacidiphila acididurans]
MDNDGSLREFLTSRRARLRPEDVGLPTSPVPRRRPGLRREEVAALAGVSVDYYARLEQGRVGKVSDQVLTAISEALRLDALERRHLRALVESIADGPRTAVRPRNEGRQAARVGLRELVASLDPLPAMVQSRRMDVLALNNAAKVLLTDFDRIPARDRNIVHWLFTDPQARTRYPDWDDVAGDTVAALRSARDPRFPDQELERLVGELSVASPEFAARWADYRLFQHSHGSKRFFHETVGILELRYESFAVPGIEGQTLTIYTAPRGSAADDKLRLLLSWDATYRSDATAPGHAPKK